MPSSKSRQSNGSQTRLTVGRVRTDFLDDSGTDSPTCTRIRAVNPAVVVVQEIDTAVRQIYTVVTKNVPANFCQ